MQKEINVPKLDHDSLMKERFNVRVTENGRLERLIVASLISHMAEKGFCVTGVWDGEDFHKANDAKSAMEAIFSLSDEASLRFVLAEGFDREKHESNRVITVRNPNAYAPNERGVFLVIGNGEDIISDYNFSPDDKDGFDAAMKEHSVENFKRLD